MRARCIFKKVSVINMAERNWIYYVQVEGKAVGKVNTEGFDGVMASMSFRKCTYAEYLRAKKLIRERETQINIDGKMNIGDNRITVDEELERR